MTRFVISVLGLQEAVTIIGRMEWARLQVGSDQVVQGGVRYMSIEVPPSTDPAAVERVLLDAGKTILARG